MNKVILAGRLSSTPELKTTPSGNAVCTFGLATKRHTRSAECDLHNIVTWDKLAENCAKFLVKGQSVFVVGEVRYRKYETKDGSKRRETDIVVHDIEFGAKPQGRAVATGSEEEWPF